MFWYLCQQIFKILIWFQLVCLRCFGYAVDDRRTGGSIDGIDHFPVLLANAESADGTFTGVIIHRDIPIFKKHTQIMPLKPMNTWSKHHIRRTCSAAALSPHPLQRPLSTASMSMPCRFTVWKRCL